MILLRTFLHALASLRLTLWLLCFLALAVVTGNLLHAEHRWLVATPLFLLALNLLATIIVNPVFRHQPGLLTFHMALLALLILVAFGTLTRFNGQAEVTVGENFDSGSVLHMGSNRYADRLEKVKFALDRFTINYSPSQGMAERDETRAYIRWLDQHGQGYEGVVGDHRPLVLAGFRFYTTHNKGFAPMFVWQPVGGTPQQGSIHLPAWPAHEHNQALEWTLPGTTQQLWTQLQFDEVILDPQQPSQFHAPKEHLLVVRAGEQRYELRPAQSINFAEGRLTYKELRTWMGFAVFYDWTLPWLFAAGLVAVLALGWHYWRKYAARPWLQEEAN